MLVQIVDSGYREQLVQWKASKVNNEIQMYYPVWYGDVDKWEFSSIPTPRVNWFYINYIKFIKVLFCTNKRIIFANAYSNE